MSLYETMREEAALLAEDGAEHPEDAGVPSVLVNRTPRQLRLARATVRRWELGKLKGESARYHYEKACAVLLSAALAKP